MNITLTEKFLNDHDACEDYVDFTKQNNLLNRTLIDATGDYNHYIDWLQHLPTLEFDSNGNKTTATTPDGDVYKYTYDSNGNKTSTTIPDGGVVVTRTFDWVDDKLSISENNTVICTLIFKPV